MSRFSWKGWMLFFMAATVCRSARAGFEWSRYEIIVVRSPFGMFAPAPDTAQPPPPDDAFAQGYRLSLLVEGLGGGQQAGLISRTSGKSLLLRKGERDAATGLELVALDMENQTARLRLGAQEAVIKLVKVLVETLPGSVAADTGKGTGDSSGPVKRPEDRLVALRRRLVAGASSASRPVLKAQTGGMAGADAGTDESGSAGSSGVVGRESDGRIAGGSQLAVERTPPNYSIQRIPDAVARRLGLLNREDRR